MKLNLGAGEDHKPGYISVDIREETDPDVLTDVGNLSMFDDDSVEEILAVDILEHTDDPVSWLKEWHRVLEPGGEIYIRVPDFDRIIDRDFIEGTPWFRTENRVLGGRENEYDQHRSLFTKEVLEERLKEAGFRNIRVKRFRTEPVHWHLGAFARK